MKEKKWLGRKDMEGKGLFSEFGTLKFDFFWW